MTPDYQTAHVTFFCRNHKGENIARIIKRAQEFIAANPMDKAAFKLAEVGDVEPVDHQVGEDAVAEIPEPAPIAEAIFVE